MKIKSRKGFTLIELMVVIAIIAILATSGISMYGTYQAKARDTKRMNNLNTLTVWLQGYYTDKSEYPEAHTTNCLSSVDWTVHPDLASYYDNKKIPLDSQKNRKAWNCTIGGSPLYKHLTKDTVPKTAYILGSNLEVKSSANLQYVSTDTTYEAISPKVWQITSAQKNATTNKENILYAIVNN